MHLLILGGTTEARQLAERLQMSGVAGLRVTSSLAGRVARPRMPVGEVRVGGFGGVEGMVAWVREHGVGGIVDATHPFAENISFNAARAAAITRVPLLALRRPGWTAGEGDRWHSVGSLVEAAEVVPRLGERVFLTTGRMGLAAFAGLERTWFLVRSVDPPEAPGPPRMEVLLDRGPFTLDGEREVLRRHRIDVVVTKDSGGAATAPKLAAAREGGLPVVVVRRPPAPEGVAVVGTSDEAAAWVVQLCAGSGASG
ncbi:cobalt-precorrin-6A reductase [Streptomyces sp. NBC_00690]|uniref:cobalt-precorrin-6A reductase n=1 Tax=Streptomyces sp. NBC_00690 TaxID=2975808 RepID=UPI002E2DDAD0|nr:cobalt-precorrin-6A reductase [Streptomyces sp. NBC_00690]